MITTIAGQLGHVLGTLEELESRLSRIQHGEYAAEVSRARDLLRMESSRLLVLRAQLACRPSVHVTHH